MSSLWWVGPLLFLALVLLCLYILYNFLAPGPTPRASYLVSALQGKYNLKRKGPIDAVWDWHRSLGEIFHIRVLHKRVHFLIGPETHQVFFDAKDQELGQLEVYRFTIPVFGKGIVYDAPQSIMNQQLRFVRHGLNGAAMDAHVVNIVKETELFFESWAGEGEIKDYHHLMSDLTIRTASRCLLGKEIRERCHGKVADYYQMLSDGMSHLSVFLPNLPTKAHRNRDYARAEMVKIFEQGLALRRASLARGEPKEHDFLQSLLDSTYKDGTVPSDEDIYGLLIACLFGGQHTSTITATWASFLIFDPSRRESLVPRLLEEQKACLAQTDGKLNFESLENMTLLHACVKETLRMFPPLIMLVRWVRKPFQYKNYTIPKDDVLITSPTVSHLLPSVWKEPLKFDPDRWLPPRNEGEGKYEFIPFGGGRHVCLGNRFGLTQVKSILSVLLRNFEFEPISPLPEINYEQIVAGPYAPTAIRYRRKAAE
jgi:sterol 14-demethylase